VIREDEASLGGQTNKNHTTSEKGLQPFSSKKNQYFSFVLTNLAGFAIYLVLSSVTPSTVIFNLSIITF